MTDDDLMRFADRETDEAGAVTAKAAIAGDPAMAAKVARYRALRVVAATAFDDVLAEPVPDSLLARLRPAPAVDDLAAARDARALRFAVPQWLALAATLVAGFVAGRSLAPSPVAPLAADAALTSSLDGSPMQAIRVGFSYRDRANDYCRIFHDDRDGSTAGVACHDGSGWRLRVVAAAAFQPSKAYRTAAADLPAAVTATVDATIVGAPLDAPGEAVAAKHGWKR